MIEDYTEQPTAPRVPVRTGRDVQPGRFPAGLHLLWQGVLLFLFFTFFIAGQL